MLAVLCLMLTATIFQASAGEPNRVLQPPDGRVPRSLFGIHIHHLSTTTSWPTVPFGTWRLWDAYVSWPWIEPAKSTWNFSLLDRDIAIAEQHHVEILLPLGLTPAWASARPGEGSAYSPGNAAPPADLNDWREYVRAVGIRYRNRVRYYEIWNEPNLKTFFSGTPPQMLQLSCEAYAILKQVDPAIQVLSPAATGI